MGWHTLPRQWQHASHCDTVGTVTAHQSLCVRLAHAAFCYTTSRSLLYSPHTRVQSRAPALQQKTYCRHTHNRT